MKLTDPQTAALTAAAARLDGAILPLPASIRGGAIGKVCDALVAKGLAGKIGEAGKQTLVISDDGRQTLGRPACQSAWNVDPRSAFNIDPPLARLMG